MLRPLSCTSPLEVPLCALLTFPSSLTAFLEPLLHVWRSALRQATTLAVAPDRELFTLLRSVAGAESLSSPAPRLFGVFLDALNAVIDEARASTTPPFVGLANLPPVESEDTYVSSPLSITHAPSY